MKKSLTFISLACFALVFCGCLAQQKPAPKQYSLYTDKCSQIPVKITNVSSLPVLQNRNIIIADGINIKTLKDARFISFSQDMLERVLLQYFGCKPSDKNSPKLSVELTELYATNEIAKVALKAKVGENEIIYHHRQPQQSGGTEEDIRQRGLPNLHRLRMARH